MHVYICFMCVCMLFYLASIASTPPGKYFKKSDCINAAYKFQMHDIYSIYYSMKKIKIKTYNTIYYIILYYCGGIILYYI